MESTRTSKQGVKPVDYFKLSTEGKDEQGLPVKEMAEVTEDSPLSLQPDDHDEFHDRENSREDDRSDIPSEWGHTDHEADQSDTEVPDQDSVVSVTAGEGTEDEMAKQNEAFQHN